MKRIALLALAGLFALGLVACSDKDASAPASPAAIEKQTSDPAKAVDAIVAAMRENRVLEAIQLAAPAAKLDEARAEWKKNMAKEVPSEEDKAEYAAQMSKLTAPDAEQALFAELEPMLAKYETEMAAQMPMMIGMGQGFLMQAVQANEDLDEAQKKQATEVVGALASWLQGVNLADRELAKKAIAITVQAARKIDLPTLDAARALDFDQAMGKAGVAFGALKDVLALYGLDINQTLDSMKTSVISRGDGVAKVSTRFTFLGKPMSTDSEMVEVDGRWYGKESMEKLVSNIAGAGSDADDADDADAASDTDAAPREDAADADAALKN